MLYSSIWRISIPCQLWIHVELIRACLVPRAPHRACYFQQYHRATWSMVQWSMSHDVPWCPMTMLTINATSPSSQKAFISFIDHKIIGNTCQRTRPLPRASSLPKTKSHLLMHQGLVGDDYETIKQNSGNCFVPGRMPKDSPHRFQTPSPKLQKALLFFSKALTCQVVASQGTGFLYVQG